MGLIIMCFVVIWFVKLLNMCLGLEMVVFVIVGWVGVKLVVYIFVYLELGIINEYFFELKVWKIMFWIVLFGIVVLGWFLFKNKE